MKVKLIASSLLPLAMAMTGSKVSGAELTLGALFEFSGDLGGNPVSGSIYDGDIHSGVTRNTHAFPSGLSSPPDVFSDSYVLQGGDPFGGDTGDDFEVSQAQGHALVSGFDIYTNYIFGDPPSQVGNVINANPDSGYLTFANNTGQAFVGHIKLSGTAFGGIYGPAQDFSNEADITLASGSQVYIRLNDESSNYGGYNHPSVVGAPDAGSTFALLGIGATSLLALRRRTSN